MEGTRQRGNHAIKLGSIFSYLFVQSRLKEEFVKINNFLRSDEYMHTADINQPTWVSFTNFPSEVFNCRSRWMVFFSLECSAYQWLPTGNWNWEHQILLPPSFDGVKQQINTHKINFYHRSTHSLKSNHLQSMPPFVVLRFPFPTFKLELLNKHLKISTVIYHYRCCCCYKWPPNSPSQMAEAIIDRDSSCSRSYGAWGEPISRDGLRLIQLWI